MQDPSIDENWFETAFDTLYPIIYAHRTVEAAEPESEFAARTLHIGPGDRVLDLCCGNGRHLVHLLRHTPHAFGLDFSGHLLSLARGQLACRARLTLGDMRTLPFVDAFDVVVNFFTSFGYFEDEDNRRVLQSLGNALKTGGRFFIDYLNPPHIAAGLIPRSCRMNGEYEIIEERWIDDAGPRVKKSTIVRQGAAVIHQSGESVQLYSLFQMQEMLSRSGLVVDAVFGDYEGAPYSDAHARMILTGHKEE